jgi:foldase protein PrsA
VEQRRKEVFNDEYSKFVESLTKNINQELWDSVDFIVDENVQTSSFFQVYKDVFMK